MPKGYRSRQEQSTSQVQDELETALNKLDMAITFTQAAGEQQQAPQEGQDLLKEANSALYEAKLALERSQARRSHINDVHFRAEDFQFPADEAAQKVKTAEEASMFAQEKAERADARRKKKEAELNIRIQQQEAIAQLGLHVLSDGEPHDLIQRITAMAAQILNAKYSKILKWLPDEDLFQIQAVAGWDESFIGTKVPLSSEGETQAAYTINMGEPVIMYDRDKETRFTPARLHQEYGIFSGISVLIEQEKEMEPFGVLEVEMDQRRQFTSDDINFLQSMANILSSTLRRRRAEDRLQESEKRFSATFEQAAVGIALVDVNGKWLRLNRKYCEILGYTHTELMNLTFQDVSYPGDKEVDDALFRTLINNGRDQYPLEKRYIRKGGYPIWVNLYCSAVRTDSGKFQYSVRVAEDISEKKHAEQILKEYQTKLEQSNNDLEHFATLASHDLQIPLRKVKAFSDIVASEEDKLSPENKDALLHMQGSIHSMQNLINDLLNLSKLSRPNESLDRVDLNKVMNRVLIKLDDQIRVNKAQIEVGPMMTVNGDETQLEQLLENLVENALKFQPKGQIPSVHVSSEGDQDICRIRVQDNGIGFKEEYSNRIFQAFERLHGIHGKSAYEGTGVGLAICKRVVERHGGRIIAHSKPGEGSIFTVELPASRYK